MPRALRWTLQLGLTAAATFFLFRYLRLSWAEVAALQPSLWMPRPVPFVGSVLVLLAVFVYLVALWSRLIAALGGPTLPLPVALQVFFLANLGRYVPGKVWQMAGLTYLAGREGVRFAVSSSAAVLAQIFSLGAATTVAGIYVGLELDGPTASATAGFALAAFMVLLVSVPSVLRLLLRVAFKIGRDETAIPEIDRAFGLRWLSLHVPAWIGYGAAFALLWQAFPALPSVSWIGATAGFAGAYVLGYLAVFAPAGIGVREGVMSVLLAPWMSAAQAAILAVIARLWMTLGELIPLAAIGVRATVDWVRRKRER